LDGSFPTEDQVHVNWKRPYALGKAGDLASQTALIFGFN
jgi:hypothetical protein